MKPAKATKCAYKGCKTKHKNSSGYCVEHAHHAERHTMPEPPLRAGVRMLFEERSNGGGSGRF